jgi:hypothetical protein
LYNGKVSTLAGEHEQYQGSNDGYQGNFHLPTDVAVSPVDGSIYVADAYNNKIRKISLYEMPAGVPDNQDEVKVVYNSSIVAFDAKPEINNDRTMVPVRSPSEALGFTVEFKASENIVHLIKGDVTIELYIGKTGLKKIVNGQPDVIKETDVAPYIKDDSIYVPVRFFAEELGINVDWVQSSHTVVLRD